MKDWRFNGHGDMVIIRAKGLLVERTAQSIAQTCANYGQQHAERIEPVVATVQRMLEEYTPALLGLRALAKELDSQFRAVSQHAGMVSVAFVGDFNVCVC